MDSGIRELESDPSLRAWRQRAADVVLPVSVILHLFTSFIPVVLLTADHGILFVVTYVVSWLVTVAAATARRWDLRWRVWLFLGALYAASFVGSLVMPDGPLLRAWPVLAPIYAIGILGRRPARMAMAVSAFVLLAVPLVVASPLAGELYRVGLTPPGPASEFLLLQGPVLVAEMAIFMVLLDRLHSYLLRSLASERRAIRDQAASGARLEAAMREQLQLERDIATIGDEERRRLGTDLHDGVCQQLAGALLRCHALEIGLERGATLSVQDVRTLSSLLGGTMEEAHAVAQGLWPLDTSQKALVAGLGRLVTQVRELHGCTCDFNSEGSVEDVDPVVGQHLYRIAQEALGNAIKHAGSGRIRVTLVGTDEYLTLSIEDDGTGFRPDVHSDGLGLRTMNHRAHVIHGVLQISSQPGGGTRIMCRVPRSVPSGATEENPPALDPALS